VTLARLIWWRPPRRGTGWTLRGYAIARQALRGGAVLAMWWNQADSWEGPVRDAIDGVYHRYAPDLVRSMVNRPVHALEPESA
jgi:hypothetical protein